MDFTQATFTSPTQAQQAALILNLLRRAALPEEKNMWHAYLVSGVFAQAFIGFALNEDHARKAWGTQATIEARTPDQVDTIVNVNGDVKHVFIASLGNG